MVTTRVTTIGPDDHRKTPVPEDVQNLAVHTPYDLPYDRSTENIPYTVFRSKKVLHTGRAITSIQFVVIPESEQSGLKDLFC